MQRTPFHLRFLGNRSARIGFVLVAAMTFLAIAGAFVPKEKYDAQHRRDAAGQLIRDHPKKPGADGFTFGTDLAGRDIFWRLIRGSYFTLRSGLGAVMLALLVGTPIGLICGYFGGWLDGVTMRLMDLLLAFPALLLALALMTVLRAMGPAAGGGGESNLFYAIIAIGVVYAPHFARVIRSTTLQARSLDYIQACRVTGCSTPRIIFRHIFPNTISPIAVLATMSLSSAILEIAALSFLGLGAADEPEWGRMMAEAKSYWQNHPHLIVVPGIALSLSVFGINLLGDGLRDALDVRLRD
jgi:ABC-type dipeptide/oligopeptide/nickel transport system permease subunit